MCHSNRICKITLGGIVLKCFLFAVIFLLSASFVNMNILVTEWGGKVSGSGIARIWAVDDGEKIKQDDLGHPLAESPLNTAWDGKKIKIFGAKNEIIAFQVIIQADGNGSENVGVDLKELVNRNFTISNKNSQDDSNPFDYRGKNIEIFTEHYVKVSQRTNPGWFYHPNAKPGDYYLGWIPDALIPVQAPAGKGGSPFDIPPGKNQGIWIDVWIPRDAPAGTYKGNVVIMTDGKLYKRIPVELEVFNFTLPDENHATNMFFLDPSDVSSMHAAERGSEQYYNLETRYRQMAHRHRIDLVSGVRSLEEMDRYHIKYLTGEMYTPANNYEGPCSGKGNTTFSIGLYGGMPREYSMNEKGWWEGSDAWEEWFRKNAPDVQRHKYLRPDEPETREGGIEMVKNQAIWTHSNPGPGKSIPGFVTIHIIPELRGLVDFWSTGSHRIFPPNTIIEEHKEEVAAGKKWGFYNGYRPSAGSVIIDADAIEFRVQPWLIFRYKADQYFYWRTTFWDNVDVFTDALNYVNEKGTVKANGDGNMFYPGQNKKYPEQDRNLEGPLSSIRMKNWRRGAQDLEYLWLLSQKGLEKEAREIAEKVIPKGLLETDIDHDITWPAHGYGFEKYRREMAEIIEKH